jgi:glycosyltransferase involved in cell wall biosynthesis
VKILLPTNRTDLLGGAETALRDLAIGLSRAGHSVVVYGDGPNDGARPMEADGIVVVRALDQLPFRPDIVHGNYSHFDTVAILTRLADVPAIFHVHGAGYFGSPPHHPRIYRYAAITQSIALRAVIESGISESAIDIVLNFVDLQRFKRVRLPRPRPNRALLYNRYFSRDSRIVSEIRKAAETRGMQLDLIGNQFGRVIEDPENALPEYDLVFASGRSAIEALACGCAVIVLGMTSSAEMVTTGNFHRLREANFSTSINAPPPTAERVQMQIDRYTADDCAAVTQKLRREADLDRTIVELEKIYAKVIAQHRSARADRRAEQQAIARYLRKIAPLVRMTEELRKPDRIAALTSAAASRSAVAALAAL